MQDPTPYPTFLQLTTVDIHQKFIDVEWEQRNRLARGVHDKESQWSICGIEMTNRNRYANVNPYQSNRVKLQVPEGHNDYINASPILLQSTASKKVTKFIVTQGPKHDTFSHIWRMIWHENTSPAVVVMLTPTHESGREISCRYYPQTLAACDMKVNEEDEFEDGLEHNIRLTSLNENAETRTQLRELAMTTEDGSESKLIYHLLFEGWPDFLVPEGADREALLKLIKLSRELNADNSTNPRIVHCSAGVGRSGTFIALDWLLQELEEGSLDDLPEDHDPIAEVVDQLRQQRMMMVQGDAQFGFLYEVLREKWRDRYWKLHPETAGKGGPEDRAQTTQKQTTQKGTSRHQSKKSKSDLDEDAHAELQAELAGADSSF
ncbi:uncharacterized protein BDZ99DRAFT_571817 [Mytilinidion resinicola]|uniref:Uncharacterized protein n=1 Tax=Mytilinidion resinicola TaxID=574789 RepID=A0A6A6YK99_9PEZI|nr:uncharacterized protein BDZ99DRAFT_571817 [Mytilinidion resinicola]KAF2808969.1 hypothetical protein BDZ99DRAFT_571817 [Mytilinidion resinicola]